MENTAENKMGVMPIGKLVLNMSVPMMISMLVQALYNVVDSIFVSMVSEEALSAVSFSFPAQNLMIGLATGTAVGVNALLSRALGAGDRERVHESIHKGLLIHLTTSALFSVIIFSGRYPMMHLFVGDDPTVIAIGAQVTALIAPCYVLFTLVEVLSSTMRGVGDAVVPAAITMVFTCIVRLIYLWGYAFSHNSNLTIAVIYPISWVLTSIAFLLYYKSRKWMPKGFHF